MKKWWMAFLVFLLVVLSYGQTLFMYFWQDDSALIFKLQHQVEASGSFGVGLWERGPYQYLVVPFVPFFKIFGLEPFGYFLIGFLSYLVVVFFFYIFSRELLVNKSKVLISTILFSVGYIGSDIMFRVINSWQSNIGLVLALISLTLYLKFFNTKRIRFYIFSLVLYFLAIELVFIRNHSLVFAFLILEFLFLVYPIKFKRLVWTFIRLLPFWLLFRHYYLGGQSIGGSGLKIIIEKILNGSFEIFASILANLGNILVTDFWQNKFILAFPRGHQIILLLLIVIFGIKLFKSWKVRMLYIASLVAGFLINKHFISLGLFWYKESDVVFSGLIGLFVIILTLFLYLTLYRKQKIIASAILFGLVFIISQIFGYFLQYPESIFSTTHRYFHFPFAGYCIFYSGLISYMIIRKKIVGYTLLLFIVSTNLVLGLRYQSKIVKERSIPTRNFYSSLIQYVPIVEKGSIFYFDVVRDSFYEKQFGDFFSVGSMPETTALAIYYNLDRYDIQMITDYDELMFKFVQNPSLIQQTYSFFHSSAGLIDTTKTLRSGLTQESRLELLDKEKTNTSKPIAVNFTMQIQPDIYSKNLNIKTDLSQTEKLQLLKYLGYKKSYYSLVSVNTGSEWKYREMRNAVDNDIGSGWQAHRIKWHNQKQDFIQVDLGKSQPVSAVLWTNWRTSLTPVSYIIEVSNDAKTWIKVKEVIDGSAKKDGELVLENFTSQMSRFVKMTITKAISDDSPSIAEFEVIPKEFVSIDFAKAANLIPNLFVNVENELQYHELIEAYVPIAQAKVNWITDKGTVSRNINIFLDNKKHKYEVYFPASGTRLIDFKILFDAPVKYNIETLQVRSVPINELNSKGLIKTFTEN